MNHQSSRQEILDRIARVTDSRPDAGEVAYTQEEIFKPVEPDELTCFKQELEAISGQCVICKDEKDMYAKLAALMQEKGLPVLFSRDAAIVAKLRQHEIKVETDESCFDEMAAGVTACEYLVARTGSAVVTTLGGSGRQMHAFPPVHIILANTNQLVGYLQDALEAVQQKYSQQMPSAITVITGPSRTADIEKTLVLGAHGPKELIIFVEQK